MLHGVLEDLGFFEGSEKLLEIWFAPAEDDSSVQGLRYITRDELDRMLVLVNAKILSKISSDSCDAYVLSESSLFVFDNKIIVKTCGATTLLLGLEMLLDLACQYGMPHLVNIFYSRCFYVKPEEQLYPHTSFGDEVEFLQRIFPGGHHHTFGKNSGEEWFFFHYADPLHPVQVDSSAEVLMRGLDLNKSTMFVKVLHPTGEAMSEAALIGDIVDAMKLDAHAFEPYGYSMNGLSRNFYQTIHVTPQPSCSYASYETNWSDGTAASLGRAVASFLPKSFLFTFVGHKTSVVLDSIKRFTSDGYTMKSDECVLFGDLAVACCLFVSS